MTLNELEVKIRDWAIERNIDKSENAPKQMIKIMEELGETSAALLKKNEPEYHLPQFFYKFHNNNYHIATKSEYLILKKNLSDYLSTD